MAGFFQQLRDLVGKLSLRQAPLERPISADVPLCPPFHITQILERLWQLGIPRVTFIVGREPDETHLVRAVRKAGELGLIAGVRGRGSDLAPGTRIADMAAAGLAHLDVYCLSERDEVHDALAGPGDRKMAARALAAALKHEVCPVPQLALVRPTLTTIGHTLESLAKHGLANASVFAIAGVDALEATAGALMVQELPPAAKLVEETAEKLGVRLMWHPTIRYDPTKPLGQQVCRGPRCSGDTAIRVEPDGAVIPARGPFCPAGNLLSDDWKTIRRSDVFLRYSRRVESDTHCDRGPGWAICAADCDGDSAGWAEAERKIVSDE